MPEITDPDGNSVSGGTNEPGGTVEPGTP
jgi:hypothetical protein